jgi:hypothetical protein
MKNETYSLSATRDLLSHGMQDSTIEERVTQIMDTFGSGSVATGALVSLQQVLEDMRRIPIGDLRTKAMNSFVRTLGQPRILAQYLDLLRKAVFSGDGLETELASRSMRGRMHCIYGWAGQTLILPSEPYPVSETLSAIDNMDPFLGYPPAEWDLSIHIWQPHAEVARFKAPIKCDSSIIVEPPHSHPFSFVSYVVCGELHESIYVETSIEDPSINFSNSSSRYAYSLLQRVDGVWPPHDEYIPACLAAVEERVLLSSGESYALPAEAIHDVEVNARTAATTPAITLFLCSEAIRKPKAYLSPDMARFHRANPDIKEVAVSLESHQWEAKLLAVSSYLRSETSTLDLSEIVKCSSTYGFMQSSIDE